MLNHLERRAARHSRRKVKRLRDIRPKAYILNTDRPLYQGGGNVGGNPRYAETRGRENRLATLIEEKDAAQAARDAAFDAYLERQRIEREAREAAEHAAWLEELYWGGM